MNWSWAPLARRGVAGVSVKGFLVLSMVGWIDTPADARASLTSCRESCEGGAAFAGAGSEGAGAGRSWSWEFPLKTMTRVVLDCVARVGSLKDLVGSVA